MESKAAWQAGWPGDNRRINLPPVNLLQQRGREAGLDDDMQFIMFAFQM